MVKSADMYWRAFYEMEDWCNLYMFSNYLLSWVPKMQDFAYPCRIKIEATCNIEFMYKTNILGDHASLIKKNCLQMLEFAFELTLFVLFPSQGLFPLIDYSANTLKYMVYTEKMKIRCSSKKYFDNLPPP
jgi:hypothetical protein